ncbi:MAG: folate-binding protein YgfZ [Chloroflexi bacterium]|nr:folate-binding protein YgfZ [Chloroflexota bacterium]
MSVVEAAAGKIAREHEAARRGAIVVDRSHEGRIRATGRDRNDLLHRMSTNDLTQMQVGEARPTVLTTAIARIVDLVWVLNYPNDLLMLVGPRQATNVRRWLSKYVFFQDEVVFTDAAEALLPGAGRLTENHFLLEGDLTILRARPLAGDGFTVIAPSAQIPELKAKAQNAGAVQAGEDTYQVLRVEAGQPYTGNELSAAYIPLEANLWGAVSFTKGCYIGQEIIARMESRGRLAKTLVGLKLAAEVVPGAEVRCDGVNVGVVSSAVVSPQAGPIALAFVKPAFAETGAQLDIGGVAGEVAAFPIV